MTFEEVYKQVNRELESQVPTDLVREILVMFFRVILEELLTNKKDAYIYIGGIGRLHLDKRQYKYNPNNVEGGEYWNITFKASKKLKALVNDRTALKEYCIGKIPMYPEVVPLSKNKIYGVGRPLKNPEHIPRKYHVKKSKPYKNYMKKKEKERIQNNLPDEE